MSLNCDQIRERLHDRLDDQLDAAALREVDEHLAACEHCRKVAEALEETRALMAELQPVSAPEGFAAGVADAIRRTPQERATRPSRWKAPGPILASLSMAAAVMLLATLSAPYLSESRTESESALPVLENRRSKSEMAPGSAKTPERRFDVALDNEDDPSLYAKEGGRRLARDGAAAERRKNQEQSPKTAEALKKLTKDAAEKLDSKAQGWGADAKPGELQKGAGARHEEAKARDELGRALEKKAGALKEELEEEERDFARGGKSGPPTGGAAAPGAPAAPSGPSGPSGRARGKSARERSDDRHTTKDADGPTESKSANGTRRQRPGASGNPAPPKPQADPAPQPKEAPADDAEPNADAGPASKPAKKRAHAAEPSRNDGDAGEHTDKGLLRKSKSPAQPARPPVAEGGEGAPNNAPSKGEHENNDDRDAEDKQRYRSGGGALGGAQGGGAASGGRARAGFAGAPAPAPAAQVEEVVLLVAKVAPDSAEARRLLAFLGANAVPAPAAAPVADAAKTSKPQPGTGGGATEEAEKAKSAVESAAKRLAKLRGETERMVLHLRTLKQGQQAQQQLNDRAAKQAQRGSTIDARLPLEAWKRLNRGVLQTIGLQDRVELTSDRPAAGPAAPTSPAPGPAAPGAPAPGGAAPAGPAPQPSNDPSARAERHNGRAVPAKVVRVLVVFEPPAPESKGK